MHLWTEENVLSGEKYIYICFLSLSLTSYNRGYRINSCTILVWMVCFYSTCFHSLFISVPSAVRVKACCLSCVVSVFAWRTRYHLFNLVIFSANWFKYCLYWFVSHMLHGSFFRERQKGISFKQVFIRLWVQSPPVSWISYTSSQPVQQWAGFTVSPATFSDNVPQSCSLGDKLLLAQHKAP